MDKTTTFDADTRQLVHRYRSTKEKITRTSRHIAFNQLFKTKHLCSKSSSFINHLYGTHLRFHDELFINWCSTFLPAGFYIICVVFAITRKTNMTECLAIRHDITRPCTAQTLISLSDWEVSSILGSGHESWLRESRPPLELGDSVGKRVTHSIELQSKSLYSLRNPNVQCQICKGSLRIMNWMNPMSDTDPYFCNILFLLN